jgi:hypothetical protein
MSVVDSTYRCPPLADRSPPRRVLPTPAYAPLFVRQASWTARARALFPRRFLKRHERLERDALHDEADAAVGALGNDARENVLVGNQLAEFAFEA